MPPSTTKQTWRHSMLPECMSFSCCESTVETDQDGKIVDVAPARLADSDLMSWSLDERSTFKHEVQNVDMTSADGMRYIGQVKFGKLFHGKGTLHYADSCRYMGEFQDGKAHGCGVYMYPDGSKYEGEFRLDAQSGHGVQTYSDGSKYKGQFDMGAPHGDGCYIGPSRVVVYQGQFVQGHMDGDGVYKFTDGRKYDGRWKMSEMRGTGSMVFPDGSKYDGDFERNSRQGEGTLELANGRKYTGQWEAGQPHGRLVVFDETSGRREGIWMHGVCIEGSGDDETFRFGTRGKPPIGSEFAVGKPEVKSKRTMQVV
eukprot:TRINITY_DN31111_c0_g1_i1.p1 TRINITY_DN31111_c0_g1~~TRINITY_DN31111_c0_g1_i1.p1  ORF type:complete len:313 (-),score=32.71 TRINITY_DN31111_c0_g1_i1:72-1010(-)